MVKYCIGLLLLTIVVADTRLGAAQNECSESRYCRENGPPIRFPFRLKHRHPDYCGYPGFSASCTSTNDTALELSIDSIPINFFVRNIDYKSQSIHIYDPNQCYEKLLLNIFYPSVPPFQLTNLYPYNCTLFNCSSLLELRYAFQISCLGDSEYQIYIIESADDIYDRSYVSCTKMYDLPGCPVKMFSQVNDVQLKWSKPKCGTCEAKGDRCKFKNNNTRHETACLGKGVSIKAVVGGTVGSSVLTLAIIALIYHVYSKDKNDKNQLRIEKFLEDYRAFKPSRYLYADIKNITDHFKDKLGEGAYGTVFKGKLSNDILVAVKILNNSNGNGEEFVNEVSTMGRIHHVNVVRLVGYCADGFRRALVYEFLPNDSLQKYIASADQGKKYSFNWETMLDITLGVAKGIEYLHQGCDQRILHFDIKPHNVLLDRNFTPKISDFGLAKLCSKDQSLVSMTTARGTLGYIAPEVFSRNFGKVSHKSDVYSFGMLLLEMVGGRKNVGETTENADQVYYPEWIYNLLEDGDDLRIHIDDEGDARIAKKLAIVGLWCIQWHPGDRPSMKSVVQMLEGGNKLTMPPNPFASTGTKRMNVNMPARNLKQDLEIIPE